MSHSLSSLTGEMSCLYERTADFFQGDVDVHEQMVSLLEGNNSQVLRVVMRGSIYARAGHRVASH